MLTTISHTSHIPVSNGFLSPNSMIRQKFICSVCKTDHKLMPKIVSSRPKSKITPIREDNVQYWSRLGPLQTFLHAFLHRNNSREACREISIIFGSAYWFSRPWHHRHSKFGNVTRWLLAALANFMPSHSTQIASWNCLNFPSPKKASLFYILLYFVYSV